MRKIKIYCCLFILFCPIFGQSQFILRLVEAEFSATANVSAYIAAKIAEEKIKKPLQKLKKISLQEILYYSVTTEFYSVFLVNSTIVSLEMLLASVQALNISTPIFFNRRFLKNQARITHYQAYLKEVSTRVNAGNAPTNRGNSAKLTLTILSELHRVSYELGKMFDYLYVRNAVSLLPI